MALAFLLNLLIHIFYITLTSETCICGLGSCRGDSGIWCDNILVQNARKQEKASCT